MGFAFEGIERKARGAPGNGMRAPVTARYRSSDVAEVAKRPKKRPGRRERSSITIGASHWAAKV
jgi:hypothetical protein